MARVTELASRGQVGSEAGSRGALQRKNFGDGLSMGVKDRGQN